MEKGGLHSQKSRGYTLRKVGVTLSEKQGCTVRKQRLHCQKSRDTLSRSRGYTVKKAGATLSEKGGLYGQKGGQNSQTLSKKGGYTVRQSEKGRYTVRKRGYSARKAGALSDKEDHTVRQRILV